MATELKRLIETASGILLGKERVIRLSLACLLARGHLLIEDLPGVGKTTLAHLLARLLGLDYQRIQFTSDLLPADILGVSVYDRDKQVFRFHQGPVFAQLVLADEINRATPKAQSALLEAMEEGQVSSDGETRPLPKPFFVIATQNPSHQVGTFPLPESQLDRFLMRVSIGYPSREAERELMLGEDRRSMIARQPAIISPVDLESLQDKVGKIFVSNALLDYCQDLTAYTRSSPAYRHGISPRAGLALVHCAKAWALLENRKEVIPEDLQAIFPATIGHRLLPMTETDSIEHGELAKTILDIVPVP